MLACVTRTSYYELFQMSEFVGGAVVSMGGASTNMGGTSLTVTTLLFYAAIR